MKKLEILISNCNDCSFCMWYNNPQNGTAFVCGFTEPKRLITIDKSTSRIEIPDWCPLETYKDTKDADESSCHQPTTVILDGLPHLEWMSENLSGHGGTEVNGRWYYTWKQAMAAANELGDGWRLPTREEFVKLRDFGSTWDEERQGRWFGGNHDTDRAGSLFFPAAGYRNYSSGAVTNVGGHGYYWSSSPYSSTDVHAGNLYFCSDRVIPVNSLSRAIGFSVRCVREIK